MQALTATKITAADAMVSVETASGGQGRRNVPRYGIDKPAYRVTAVTKDGTETIYLIDANTGTATLFTDVKSSADAADENEGGGEVRTTGPRPKMPTNPDRRWLE